MWDRLRRRTLSPGRPLLYTEQFGLAIFTLIALGAGTFAVVRYLL